MRVHLGIDIGATFVKFGVVDPEGHILFSDRKPTRGDEGQEAAVETILNCARQMVTWAQDAGHEPGSVGVGSPGTTNPLTHRIQPPSPNIPVIVGLNLAELVGNATGLPATVDNDANCAAWAEYRFGAARGIDNLVCLTIGSGIGSGFIIDGKILSGPTGSGGELGHVSIDWNGPVCPCGSRGCLELYTSATALLRIANAEADTHPDGALAKARNQEEDGLSIGTLIGCAAAGDHAAQHILDESADQLGIGILAAVNIVDPEAIILGGGVADADAASGGRWLGAIARYVRSHAFSEAGQRLRIGRAVLGNDAGFIGAAALGAERMTGESD